MSHHHYHHESHEAAHSVAKGLGWFSIALGIAQLSAPQRIARSLGMRGSERMIQACGMGKIASGAGILASGNPAPWLWSRVAGDAIDLTGLAGGMQHGNRQRRNMQLAMAATAGVTLLDIFCAQKMSEAAKQRFLPMVDYSDRDGFPKGVAAARGAAKDFDPGRHFSTPEALRPWQDGKPQAARSGSDVGTGHGGSGKGRDARGVNSNAPLGKAVAGSTSVLGSGSLQQAAGSHERDDAFRTGPTFTGKGNEGP